MQLKLVAFYALSTLAAATPTRRADCSTGPLQCCQSTGTASDAGISKILGLLGVVVDDLNVLVGVSCSPISVIDVGSDCSAHPVCCDNNSFGGLISIGCVPVII